MARILTQTLLRHSSTVKSGVWSPRFLCSKAQLIEIDLDPTSSSSSSSQSSSSSDGGEFEVVAIKKLEDIIQRIIVQKSTPDWLPFVPGSSFWVPPRRGPSKVIDLVGKLADQIHLTQEESLSLITSRGWPSSSFFTQGSGYDHPTEVDLEVKGSSEVEVEEEVKVLKNSDSKSGSEHEEG